MAAKKSTSSSGNADNDKLLTIRLLETPAGQEVLGTFFYELITTRDPFKAGDRAKKVAEENGTLVPFEITLVVDFLIRVVGPAVGPALIKYFLSPKKEVK